MNQGKQSNLGNNGYNETSTQVLAGINQNLIDANEAVLTHAGILKNNVRQSKLNQFQEFKNEVISELNDLPKDILEADNWNSLKNDAKDSFEEMSRKTITNLKNTNENLNYLGKSIFRKSSQTLSTGKDFISKNTPKLSKKFGESIKSVFRNKSLNQKDIDMLEKLAKLKESGIITQKEFNSNKKKILNKI